MKKMKLIIGSGLALSLFAITPMMAYAESSTGTGTGTDSSNATTTTTTTDKTTETKPLTAEESAKKLADMKKRLEENKAALKTKLDEVAKKRIIAKCKPAQAIVKGAETSANAISTNRGKAYTKIAESVQKLIDKLKADGKDTAELESALATAKQKAEALSAKMKTYEQTLADIREMDCAADPTAFQAALESARTQRDAIKTAATDFRTYVSTTLKAAVKKFKPSAETEQKTTEVEKSTSTAGGTQ
jgi:hypothetical protein